MNIRSFFKRGDKSIYNPNTEGELTNIIISFLVVASLLVFPFAVLGLVAVAAWGLFFVASIIRKYSYFAISSIGLIFVTVSVYQGVLLVDHIEEQRLYGNPVIVTPTQQQERVDSIEIDVKLNNDNVSRIDYQFSTTYNPDPNNWQSLNFNWETNESNIYFEAERSAGYFLILRVFYYQGDRSLSFEYFGRYQMRAN